MNQTATIFTVIVASIGIVFLIIITILEAEKRNRINQDNNIQNS